MPAMKHVRERETPAPTALMLKPPQTDRFQRLHTSWFEARRLQLLELLGQQRRKPVYWYTSAGRSSVMRVSNAVRAFVATTKAVPAQILVSRATYNIFYAETSNNKYFVRLPDNWSAVFPVRLTVVQVDDTRIGVR